MRREQPVVSELPKRPKTTNIQKGAKYDVRAKKKHANVWTIRNQKAARLTLVSQLLVSNQLPNPPLPTTDLLLMPDDNIPLAAPPNLDLRPAPAPPPALLTTFLVCCVKPGPITKAAAAQSIYRRTHIDCIYIGGIKRIPFLGTHLANRRK